MWEVIGKSQEGKIRFAVNALLLHLRAGAGTLVTKGSCLHNKRFYYTQETGINRSLNVSIQGQ